MSKLLRRRVYCRETDFKKHIRPNCAAVGYHRWSWEPVRINRARGEIEWNILKGEITLPEDYFVGNRDFVYADTPNEFWDLVKIEDELFGRRFLNYIQRKGQLYNPKWKNWSWNFEKDMISIRYYRNKPWVPLGIATVERDY